MAQRNAELKGDRCPKCNGRGLLRVNTGSFYIRATCDECRGTGLVNSPNACKYCKGSGTITAHFGDIDVVATCFTCSGSGLKPIKN